MATGTVILDGEKVRRLRLGKGWSQYRACDELEDLARKNGHPELSVSVRTWQRAEQGLPIQASSARSIAAALAGTASSTSIDALLNQLLVSTSLDTEPDEASGRDTVSATEAPRSIVEYLYVDERRLDAYVEQIGLPIEYDRVPNWDGETLPSCREAAGAQGVHSRPLTRTEKIEMLLQHLTASDLIATSRPTSHLSQPTDFATEICMAAKVVVPPKSESGIKSPSLNVWISLPIGEEGNPNDVRQRSRAGMLCLIEDWSQADREPFCLGVSGYTFLSALLASLNSESQQNVLTDFRGFAYGDYVRISEMERISPFVADPFGALEDLGCTTGTPRHVRVLYRIREICPYTAGHYMTGEHVRIGTLAYPIFIAAEAEPKWTHAADYVGSSVVIRLTNYLIATALERGAERVRVSSHNTRVSAKAGDQVVWSTDIPQQELPHVIARLKTIAGIDPSSTRSVQEGTVRCSLSGHLVNLRVLVVPADTGEDCWVQLLIFAKVK